MKKKALLLASMGVLACTVGVTALVVGGANQLDTFAVKASPTGHSFTFNAATGSQFASEMGTQEVDVITGISSPIRTIFTTITIGELNFGENGRFVEALPAGGDASYSLEIGINNLTHFEIDMGVEYDEGPEDYWDIYKIELLDKGGNTVRQWDSQFEPDSGGNDTVHLEWDKGPSDSTVVEVLVKLYLTYDSPDTNLYIESLSLTWEC